MTDPAAYPTLLGADAYTDPARHHAERHRVFARHWHAVGDVAQLAAPGDRLAVTVAGFPLLVVNDGGMLRGFHNVCRHRGGPLAPDGEGRGPALVCRYHGWSYGLDGSLRSARDFGDDALCPEALSLRAVRVAAWRGLVFATLDDAGPELEAWLGAMADACRGFDMERFVPGTVPGSRAAHAIGCNWKVYAENYQEGYHIPLVHPGLNRQVEARAYRVEAHDDGWCSHHAPARDGSVTAGAWLWRFPGFALNLYPAGMSVESFHPTGPASTEVRYAFYFAPGTPPDEQQAAVDSSTTVLDEDRAICEAVQRAMASGLYQGGWCSPRHEGGVRLVQALVAAAMED